MYFVSVCSNMITVLNTTRFQYARSRCSSLIVGYSAYLRVFSISIVLFKKQTNP